MIVLVLALSALVAGQTGPSTQPASQPSSAPSAPPGPGQGHQHRHRGGHHGFSDTGKYVEMFESPDRAAWQKPAEVVAALNLRRGMKVADIGSGSGYFTVAFARGVGPEGKVFAVDIEPGMVEHINKRAIAERATNIAGVLASPDDPKLPEKVDLVFICDTWHHVEGRVAYLERLAKHLKPGARVAIVDFHKHQDIPVGPPPKMRLRGKDVIAELEQAGFRLVERYDFLPYQYFLVFARK